MLSAEKAAAEILRRKQIRGQMGKWCEHAGYAPAKHHRLLIEHLEKVFRGEIDRLAVFMPPGSAKSTYASILFPPWVLANDPQALFLAASHTTELAERWGRRVRNLIAENAPILKIALSEDNQAAGRWGLQEGGEYMAAGANVGIAGFRAKYGLIDDPIRSRQDADSLLVRDRIWDWYLNDFRPRLVPGARQVLIQCMTGDTSVLMSDGRERPLRDIRVGDVVATYSNGELLTSTVRNWISNGFDRVLMIRMASGTVVKANARHPFLVCESGVLKWIRTQALQPGHAIFRVNGESGRAKLAQVKVVKNQPSAGATAIRTTIKSDGRMGFVQLPAILSRAATRILSIAMGSLTRCMRACLPNRMANVLSVGSYRGAMFAHTGAASSASIIATTRARSEDCFATTATLSLGMPKPSWLPNSQQITSDFTLDRVAEIIAGDIEEVFDIQIDQTENFIANGLVSHNTRWHEDDLAGRCLNHQPWTVLSLPAFAKPEDALGRAVDQPLWADDDYGYGDQLVSLRDTTPPRIWSALYQQSPAPDEGDYFREEWLKARDIVPSHKTLRVYGGSDYAVTKDGGDYTCHVVVGIDHLNNMYLLDIWRGQKSPDVWIDAFCDLVIKYRPLAWAEEGGQIKASIGPFLEKRMRARRCYVNREQFPTRGDKAVRARSIQGRMALDGIYYQKTANWVADFLAEILNFPASKHDDQVDALGLVGQLLDQMVIGIKGKVPTMKLKEDGYRHERKTDTIDYMTL